MKNLFIIFILVFFQLSCSGYFDDANSANKVDDSEYSQDLYPSFSGGSFDCPEACEEKEEYIIPRVLVMPYNSLDYAVSLRAKVNEKKRRVHAEEEEYHDIKIKITRFGRYILNNVAVNIEVIIQYKYYYYTATIYYRLERINVDTQEVLESRTYSERTLFNPDDFEELVSYVRNNINTDFPSETMSYGGLYMRITLCKNNETKTDLIMTVSAISKHVEYVSKILERNRIDIHLTGREHMFNWH